MKYFAQRDKPAKKHQKRKQEISGQRCIGIPQPIQNQFNINFICVHLQNKLFVQCNAFEVLFVCVCVCVCVCLLAVRFHFVSVLSTQEFVNNFQLLCKAFRMSSREWKRRRSKGNTWENQLEKIPFIFSHIRFAWKYTAYNFENINLRKLQNNMNCLWIVRLFTLCYLFDLNETWDAKCCSEINLLCGITKARHSRYVCFRRGRERERRKQLHQNWYRKKGQWNMFINRRFIAFRLLHSSNYLITRIFMVSAKMLFACPMNKRVAFNLKYSFCLANFIFFYSKIKHHMQMSCSTGREWMTMVVKFMCQKTTF